MVRVTSLARKIWLSRLKEGYDIASTDPPPSRKKSY